VVVFADVGDAITFTPGAPPDVTVAGPFANAIDGENIVARALRRIGEVAPTLMLGAVAIEKRLPVAAGIGGGSADAAAVLRAVMRANSGSEKLVDWLALAAELGADVPVCLGDTPQFMWGIGRETAPLPAFPTLPAILVNPRVPVATADVFRTLGASSLSSPPQRPMLPGPFARAADVISYLHGCGNDLEPPALRLCSAIGDVLSVLRADPGVEIARMSGSGATCFGIFQTRAAAVDAALRLRARAPGWWIEAVTLG
jgi:4-diphosphocytidyl-2-C-methyl-D-erythritol kinase